jgi:hypothetical protein
MKSFLSLMILGLFLAVAGFAVLFVALGGSLPPNSFFVGFALIILGPLIFIGGLAASAFRRPTPKELASQDPRNPGTWHFSRAGCLVLAGFFLALGVAVTLNNVLKNAFADNAMVVAIIAVGGGIGGWVGNWLLCYLITSPGMRGKMYRIQDRRSTGDAEVQREVTEGNNGNNQDSEP